MCGIAGAAWSAGGKPLSGPELSRMVAAVRHRGPDDAGFWPAGTADDGAVSSTTPGQSGAALGHRRLSIIDLDGGRQPMADATGEVLTAFNGEIFNYRELRADLVARGHAFRSESDTEVLLEAYKAFGVDCVSRFRGMFAFAVWDGRRLFLARDRLGQKPLYYRHAESRLLFASELKSLLQADGAPRELDPTAIDDYLAYQYVPHTNCIFRGYAKLLPGHALTYDPSIDRLDVVRYWSPPYDRVGRSADGLTIDPAETARWSPADWRAELRRRLTEAVRLRLRSDVPLGAFLSGGIDSTIVVGLMQEILREAGAPPVSTFTIGFPVAAFDERAYARDAAAHLGTDHRETVVEPDAASLAPALAWHFDEPFADWSAMPTMLLSEWTRRHVTVALSGDGGDELFCGYDRYPAFRPAGWSARLPGSARRLFATAARSLPPPASERSVLLRLRRFAATFGAEQARRYMPWVAVFEADARRDLYAEGFAARLDGHDAVGFLADAFAACPNRDFMTRAACADVLTYLPCDILTKVDLASMATGLEARSPFLDHHVAELAALMPIGLKQTAEGGKRILIETFRDLLPESIRTRRKMGFSVPIGHWFRGSLRPLLEDVLFDSRTRSRDLFRPDAVATLVQQHLSGRWDHGHRLWALLMLELWFRTYVDAPTPPMQAPAAYPIAETPGLALAGR